MLVCRRSRRARLLGACARARLATFAFTFAFGSGRRPSSRFRAKTSLDPLLRVHDQELLAALTFPCPRAHLSALTATLHRLTVHGLANSCHVSTSAGDDPLPFEDRTFTSHPATAPALAFRPWRLLCRTALRFVFALRRSRPALPHVDPLRSCTSCDVHARNQPPLYLRSPVLLDRLPLATEALRPQRSDRPASLDAHDLPALPCSRSRTCSWLLRVSFESRSTFTHMFSHIFRCRPLSIRAPSNAETCQPQHLEKFGTF